jgi:flagellar biosynthesis component FlhA
MIPLITINSNATNENGPSFATGGAANSLSEGFVLLPLMVLLCMLNVSTGVGFVPFNSFSICAMASAIATSSKNQPKCTKKEDTGRKREKRNKTKKR